MIHKMYWIIFAPSVFAVLVQHTVHSCRTNLNVSDPFLHRSRRQTSRCRPTEFPCGDGSCVSLNNICDGSRDCTDGGDELVCDEGLTNLNVSDPFLHRSRRQTSRCRLDQWKCGDGSCISLDGKCDGTNNCQDGSDESPALCQGNASQCHLSSHPSVEYRCLVFGSVEGSRICDEYEPTGTVVSPQCRGPVYHSAAAFPYMRCHEGRWDYIATCVPDCGTVVSGGKQFVIGGETARRAEVPWHVGIYTKLKIPYQQLCGGSIISKTIVISAAHCFWTDVQHQLSAAEFAVAAGKLYRPWNENQEEAQKSDVKSLHLPVRFQGSAANFQDDIAVIIVATPFQYNTFIRPVCVDFDNVFEKRQLQSGNKGKVAGWGLTSENGRPSQILKVVDLPYVGTATCISESPIKFQGYITSDKICAGVKNGRKALCQGDSGGGLAFPGLDRGRERYFLRGIVSSAPDNNDLCNANAYTTFTQLLRHEHFIKQFWVAEDAASVNIQSNGDGTRLQKEICTLPDYPEHGTYTTNIPDAKPRDAYDAVTINVTCEQGYATDASSSVSCNKGWWNETIPKCVLQCHLKQHPSVKYRCLSNDFIEGYRPCNEYEISGTVVSPKCETDFYSSTALTFMQCIDGNWDYIARCYEDEVPVVKVQIAYQDTDKQAQCQTLVSPLLVAGKQFHLNIYSNVQIFSPGCFNFVNSSFSSLKYHVNGFYKEEDHYRTNDVLIASVDMRPKWSCTIVSDKFVNPAKCPIQLYVRDAVIGYLKLNGEKMSSNYTSGGEKYATVGHYNFFDGELLKISCHRTRQDPDYLKLSYMTNGINTLSTELQRYGPVVIYIKLTADNDGAYVECTVSDSNEAPKKTDIVRLYFKHKQLTD